MIELIKKCFWVQGATYAIGNAAFHSSELYMKLKPVVPTMVELMKDPMAKTRANAASMYIYCTSTGT